MRGVRALDLGADRPRDAQGAGIAGVVDRTTRAAEDESLVGWAKVRSTPAYLSTSTAQHRAHAVICQCADRLLRVGTAHDRNCRAEMQCQRLCPPYEER